MSIRTRLLVSALVSTALVVVVGSIGALSRRAVDQELRQVEQESLPLVEALEDVRFAGLRIVASTSEYVLIRTLNVAAHSAPKPGVPEPWSAARDSDADERSGAPGEAEADADAVGEEARLRQSGVRAYTAAVDVLDRLANRGAQHLDFEDLRQRGSGLLAASGVLLELSDHRADSDRLLEAKEVFEEREQLFLACVDRKIQRASEGLNQRSTAVRDRVARDYRLSVVALVLASGFALVMGLRVASAVRRPLDMLKRASDDIAAGRHTVSLPSSSPDEVGAVARAFGEMVDTLGRTTVSKAFVDDIVASIPDGVLVIDAERRVVRANPALVTLLGATHEQALVGRAVDELIPALRELDGIGGLITSVATAHGDIVSVSVSASVMTTTSAGHAGYVCLVQDIRERLAVERALTQAKEQAEAGVRVKSEFLATMSHELRTPLNAIIGYAELLQDEAAARLAYTHRTDLERIRSSGLLLLELVNQVLDLAKMEAGKLQVNPGSVDPGALVDQVATIISPMLSPNTALRVDVSPDLATLTTDGEKLRQVLLNLGSNACKFTKAGHVQLTARSRPGAGGSAVEFEVIDTGIGMSPEFLQQIFTPFSQAHGSPTGKYSGSGLGMAIAKRLSDALGATLTVRSTLGVGTEMSLVMPTQPHPLKRVAA
ncbi:MAG: ATP-binding protein [Vicinamibacterales bacterium]